MADSVIRIPQSAIEISVEDTGPGIEPGDHERIFRAFEQVDMSSTRKHQGTGLGLALVKRFVEMHGGRVWVESEGQGRGSTFRFTIPVNPDFDIRISDFPMLEGDR